MLFVSNFCFCQEIPPVTLVPALKDEELHLLYFFGSQHILHVFLKVDNARFARSGGEGATMVVHWGKYGVSMQILRSQAFGPKPVQPSLQLFVGIKQFPTINK